MSESTPSAITSASQLSQYIEAIEHLEEENRALMAYIRELYSEARTFGLSQKLCAKLLKCGSSNS